MKQENGKSDYTLLLMLIALFLFHSPFSNWWLSQKLPWYTAFFVWGFILLLVAINQWRIAGTPD